ncbi:MAG: AMP-binding protein, partial [Undibacterium sp.]|nr:AMP-binding protein [Undibacterium sp.]
MNLAANFTIIDHLHEHVRTKPDALAFCFLSDLEAVPQDLSYSQLLADATAVADFLKSRAEVGSRIMLFFPPGLAYLRAFYGCLLAGMVAVPLYPPRRNVKSDRIINVAQSCEAVIALTTESELANVQAAWLEQNTLGLSLTFHASDKISNDHIEPALAATSASVLPSADAPAFLQYTSGSTGTPKGVIVTHANILANSHHLMAISSACAGDVFVNWVPAFHDLGLVTAVLLPVVLGNTTVLMAPASFVRDPAMWLKAISRYKGSLCGAPNFAFDLCTDKIDDVDLEGLDLSSWRVAYNAAEPVRADTLQRFSQRFAAVGFRPEAFFPSYGLAETTLAISGSDWDALPTVLTVDKQALGERRIARLSDGDAAGTQLVACGTTPAPHALRI